MTASYSKYSEISGVRKIIIFIVPKNYPRSSWLPHLGTRQSRSVDLLYVWFERKYKYKLTFLQCTLYESISRYTNQYSFTELFV